MIIVSKDKNNIVNSAYCGKPEWQQAICVQQERARWGEDVESTDPKERKIRLQIEEIQRRHRYC